MNVMRQKIAVAMVAVMMAVCGVAVGASGPVFAEDNTKKALEPKSCPSGMIRTRYYNSISECSMPYNGNTEPSDEDVIAEGKEIWTTVNTIINIVLGIVGFIAVVVIIFGGFKFMTSAGDAGKVKSGRDTILYGVVGLIVALLAFAIVNFALGAVFGKSNTNDTNTGGGGGSAGGSGSQEEVKTSDRR